MENKYINLALSLEKNLDNEDVNELNFLCQDFFDSGTNILENLRNLPNMYSHEFCFNLMIECVYLICRRDILRRFDVDQNTMEDRFRVFGTSEENRSLLAPFIVLLYKLAMNILDDEIDGLKLFASSYRECIGTDERFKRVGNSLDFMRLMKSVGAVKENEVLLLRKMFEFYPNRKNLELIASYINLGNDVSSSKYWNYKIALVDNVIEESVAGLQRCEEDCYKMDSYPRGLCAVINNEKFDGEYSNREGSLYDEERIKSTFINLGYVLDVSKNLTCKEIESKLKDLASRDHSKYSCFILIILSHGSKDSIYGVDCLPLDINHVLTYFKPASCPKLTGKPKIFIIQACQGSHIQMGAVAEEDGSVERNVPVMPRLDILIPEEFDSSKCSNATLPKEEKESIPIESDIVLCMSTVDDYVSFRSITQGTWYITDLCQVLEEDAHRSFFDVMTRVNNRVAQRSNPAKQMPNIKICTLRKTLYLNPPTAVSLFGAE